MNATFTELLPATKSSKHNSFNFTPAETGPGGFLTIHTGKKSAEYLVVEFGTPWAGRAFHFAKVTTGTDPEAESYDVFVCVNGQNNSCQCKGFLFHGTTCKHIESAKSLWNEGWLPQDQANGEADVSSTEAPF